MQMSLAPQIEMQPTRHQPHGTQYISHALHNWCISTNLVLVGFQVSTLIAVVSCEIYEEEKVGNLG